MSVKSAKAPVEFGDFQTPQSLADKVCETLRMRGVCPTSVLEPTCGIGAFLVSALAAFPQAQQLHGLDISAEHTEALLSRLARLERGERVSVRESDFFSLDWRESASELAEPVLVIGNPPWVTNAVIGSNSGTNLPTKKNFQGHSGLDALTGKSNFDISEWMLIHIMEWLNGKRGTMAMLCKTAVARKLLHHAWKHAYALSDAAMYPIDAMADFGAAVDACLLVCDFAPGAECQECGLFAELQANNRTSSLGYCCGNLVASVDLFEKTKHLRGIGAYKWRSGVKHDCSAAMELFREGTSYRNGIGEMVDIEPTYLYPMMKTSEVANDLVPRRWMLVTQHSTGEDTRAIAHRAPKTWRYLEQHAHLLDSRGSSIYKERPRYSVFGVGPYAFTEWKVAISGFYKRLSFRVIGPFEDKPVVLDDATYFLACENQDQAERGARLLNSEAGQDFFLSYVFWDSKRPITTSILNMLDINALSKEADDRPFWDHSPAGVQYALELADARHQYHLSLSSV